MNSMRKLFALVLVASAALVGCGDRDPAYDDAASKLLNSELAPMAKLKGQEYRLEIEKRGSSNDACFSVAKVDGMVVEEIGGGALDQVGGVDRCQLDGVVVTWTAETGYRVAPAKALPLQISRYMLAESGSIFRNYQ